MSCSQSKTEIMVFHPKTSHHTTVLFKGTALKQVAVKRALGIQLDQHLDFRAQVAEAKARSLSSLRKISVFSKEMGGASMEVMLTLYQACIRPLMLLSYPVWCSASNTSMSQLESVQHQALTKATNAMAHSNSSSLEVLCNIPPLDLVCQQILIQTFIQIARHPDTYF